jgi:hypothetical protein
MLRLAFLLLFLLAACDGTTPIAAPTGTSLPAQPVASDTVDNADRVACALARATAFTPTCIAERARDAEGPMLTIRHPDGGFRRFRITADGRGVIAADGAEPARVRVTGRNEIEVDIGGDRYRLPATVGGAVRPSP